MYSLIILFLLVCIQSGSSTKLPDMFWNQFFFFLEGDPIGIVLGSSVTTDLWPCNQHEENTLSGPIAIRPNKHNGSLISGLLRGSSQTSSPSPILPFLRKLLNFSSPCCADIYFRILLIGNKKKNGNSYFPKWRNMKD